MSQFIKPRLEYFTTAFLLHPSGRRFVVGKMLRLLHTYCFGDLNKKKFWSYY